MLAVGMVRGKRGLYDFELPMPEIREDDEVLVRVKEVGLDGTDFNMLRYGEPDIAEGRNEIALGHEMVGVVEEAGKAVKTLAPGDLVTMTNRRGCGLCSPCLHNQSDMCLTGLFTERGIHKQDGFLTRFVVDQEQYIAKVPPELKRLAVLTEPLSIAEKGIEQARIIQSRLHWTCPHLEHTYLSEDWGGCKSALVVGQGPLGLLASALLGLTGVRLYAADIMPPNHIKAELSRQMGAHYIDARERTPDRLVELCCEATGTLDMIFEASGAAATAVRLIYYMARSSIYVMTGIPRGDLTIEVDAAQMVRQLVRYNQVVVGSVNSNRSHFEKALKEMAKIQSRFPQVLKQMFTHRYPIGEYYKAFQTDAPDHIKTIIEVEPWD